MSLTLEVEQRLEAVGLIALFGEHQEQWFTFASRAYQFVRENYPEDSTIRRDDVAKALIPLLTVDETLGAFLDANKLRQKYWIRDFADLIIDREWQQMSGHHVKKKPK
jgi:hypothetical protein